MFARLSFVFPLLALGVHGLGLNSESTGNLTAVAKILATGIIAAYNQSTDSLGLFGQPYSFWEDGALWNALIDYQSLTGDEQYVNVIYPGIQFQIPEKTLDYMPANQTKNLGNDDQSSWALAVLSAAEWGWSTPVYQNFRWIDIATNVFNEQAARWDESTCGGGLKWQIFSFNNGYNYKNSGSAAQFFLLSARLFIFTQNQTYSDWASKTFHWMQDSGLMDKEYRVYDGADDTQNCSSVNKIQWSYTNAMFLEGAALMYNKVSISTSSSSQVHKPQH